MQSFHGMDPRDPHLKAKLRQVHRALAVEAKACRSDLGRFFQFVYREEHTGRALRTMPHQQVYFDFVQAHPRCVVRGPMNSSKTYLATAWALYRMGNDVNERGAFLSAAQTLASKPMNLLRQQIDANPRLKLVFPNLVRSERIGDPWTNQRFTVQRDILMRDPTVQAIGLDTEFQGSRLSWFNADDLLTRDNTISEAQRESLFEWFTSSAEGRLDADGSCVITQVPWFDNDLTYQLEKGHKGIEPWPTLTFDALGDIEIRNTDWDSDLIRPAYTEDAEGVRHRLVAHDTPEYARRYLGIDTKSETWIDEADQIPLWPERKGFDAEALAAEHKKIGTLEFNRRRRSKVADPSKQRVQSAWIELCKQNARAFNATTTVANWTQERSFVGIDPAFGLGRHNDRTSFFAFAVLPSGHRRILEVKVGRFKPGDLISMAVDAANRFGAMVCVEGNSAQRLIRDWCRERDVTVRIRARDTTGKNKMDPDYGVESIFMEVEAGAWLIPHDPRKPNVYPPGVGEWISDLYSYRPGQHTGDVLMSSWMAREMARKLGLLGKSMLPGGAPPRSNGNVGDR